MMIDALPVFSSVFDKPSCPCPSLTLPFSCDKLLVMFHNVRVAGPMTPYLSFIQLTCICPLSVTRLPHIVLAVSVSPRCAIAPEPLFYNR